MILHGECVRLRPFVRRELDLVEATFFDDHWRDLAIYSLLRGEWERRK